MRYRPGRMRRAKISRSSGSVSVRTCFSSELQDAADFGRVGQVRQRAQVHGPFRLSAVAVCEAALPRPAARPGHRNPLAPVPVVKLDGRRPAPVRRHARLPAPEVGEQTAGCEVSRTRLGNVVGAGAGGQHGRFAATVGSGQHRHRILERKAQVPDAAQLPDADFHKRVPTMPVGGAQGVPDVVQLPGDQRHVPLPNRRRTPALAALMMLLAGRSWRYSCRSVGGGGVIGIAPAPAAQRLSTGSV